MFQAPILKKKKKHGPYFRPEKTYSQVASLQTVPGALCRLSGVLLPPRNKEVCAATLFISASLISCPCHLSLVWKPSLPHCFCQSTVSRPESFFLLMAEAFESKSHDPLQFLFVFLLFFCWLHFPHFSVSHSREITLCIFYIQYF